MAPEIATSSVTTSMTDVASSFSNNGSTFRVLSYKNVSGGVAGGRLTDNSLSWCVSDRISQRVQIDDGDRHALELRSELGAM
jgi:hypothetical protein